MLTAPVWDPNHWGLVLNYVYVFKPILKIIFVLVIEKILTE